MLDAVLRPFIDPPLDRLARAIDRPALTPNTVTFIGLFIGLNAIPALWLGLNEIAIIFILLNRLCDGLDGAVARMRLARGEKLPLHGGFLDICADFIFYGAIPLGFALQNPESNAVGAAFLLAAFMATGVSFVAFSTLATQLGLTTDLRGKKSFYYLGGLAEGTETIFVFVLACIAPSWFPWIALIYGIICWVTVIVRFFEVREKVKDLDH